MNDTELLAARERLHRLEIPADLVPEDLVPVVLGGTLMPSLPGWTPLTARDWADVVLRWPAQARRIMAWTEAYTGRLANLEIVSAWLSDALPEIIINFCRKDYFSAQIGDRRRNDYSGLIDPAQPDDIETDLERVLSSLDRCPRPWHGWLTEAITGAISQSQASVDTYRFPIVTRIRILDDAVRTFLIDHIGEVNFSPFCQAQPGELLLENVRADNIGVDSARQIRITYEFVYRTGMPWPDTDSADFFTLP